MSGEASLPPFDTPRDYSFEPELEGPAPREVPAKLRLGPHGRRQRQQVWGLVIAGVTCLVAAFVPIVQEWGLYLLPLAWLHWVGAALLAIAGIVALVHALQRGPYRYVQDGLPLIARIVALELRATAYLDTQPMNYRYVAVVEYRDPQTREVQQLETSSNDFSAGKKDSLDCTYQVGDYVTAVYLPDDLRGSLRLYGFLDLRPGLGLVPRQHKEPGGEVVKVAGLVVLIVGLFFVLCWNVYALSRYGPLEYEPSMLIPGLGGGALLGGALLAVIAWEARRQKRQREAQGVAAPTPGVVSSIFLGVIVFAGSLLLGGATVLCWALTLNAWLDSSPPTERPIRITRMVHITHSGVFRRYEIKYQFADDPGGKTHDYLSTPHEMNRFGRHEGVAHQRAGYFGWRWVERLVP